MLKNSLVLHSNEILRDVEEVRGEVVVLLEEHDIAGKVCSLPHSIKHHVHLVCVYVCVCIHVCVGAIDCLCVLQIDIHRYTCIVHVCRRMDIIY